MADAQSVITTTLQSAMQFRDSAVTSVNAMVSTAMSGSTTIFTPGNVDLKFADVPGLPVIDTSLEKYKPVSVDQLLTVLPTLPAEWARLLDEYFPVTDLERVAALMREFIKPEYLANVRAVFVGDLERSLAGRRREVLATFQERGFVVPSGAMAGALAGVEAAADDKVREYDSDLAAKAMERWFEFSKWLVQVYVEAKRAEFEAFVQLVIAYMRAQLDHNKNRTDTAIAMADIAKAEAALKTQVANLSFERARLVLAQDELRLKEFDTESRLQIEALHNNVASQNNATATRVSALNAAAKTYANVASSAMSAISGIAVVSEAT